MELETVSIGDLSARAHIGGEGEPVVLLHGGWAGAAAHWSTVWEQLGERFRIVAPELPGIADATERPLRTFGAYADWLRCLLDVLAIPSAWIVGNSFGASVAWRFASQSASKCRGLVMVNGFAAPAYPTALRWLITKTLLRRVALAQMRRVSYSPAALEAAFHDPERAPAAIATTLTQPSRAQLEAVFDVLLSGESPCPPPRIPVLLLWGADDHLPMVDATAARKLAGSLPNSELVLLSDAGHLPQVERPAEFLQALVRFIDGTPRRAAS